MHANNTCIHHIHTHINVHKYTHRHTHTSMHTHTHTQMYTNTHTHAHSHACTHAHTHNSKHWTRFGVHALPLVLLPEPARRWQGTELTRAGEWEDTARDALSRLPDFRWSLRLRNRGACCTYIVSKHLTATQETWQPTHPSRDLTTNSPQ